MSVQAFEQSIRGFFAPVVAYLDDASVSEILINGPDEVFVERKGRLERSEARFESRAALVAAVRNLSQYVGKLVDEEHPILEGRLPDGSRVEAVLPPASPDGPHVAIRRFFKETLTVARLVELGSLTPLAADALAALVEGKANVIVAGGTGSGKTSMLNALSGLVPTHERIVTIEDSREVQFGGAHVVSLEARPGDPKGRGRVTIRDLFKATLRMRPDRIVVGEIRGGEALEILQAMTSGHGGSMGTLHATHPRDALTRLETMCLMSDVVVPLHALRVQIASAIQVIVQCGRLRDGSRKVTHISEVHGYDAAAGRFLVRDMFRRVFHGADDTGRLVTDLVPTGVRPSFLEELEEHGAELPEAYWSAGRADEAEARRGAEEERR